jgi:HK97 gp10 family phage protein
MAVIGVTGLEQLLSQVGQKFAQMESQIDQAVQGAGIDCAKYAKIACPVDTGRLRSSIQYENKGSQKCIVETTVNYAIFVEAGTYKQAAQPFMGPAYEQAKAELMEKLKKLR